MSFSSGRPRVAVLFMLVILLGTVVCSPAQTVAARTFPAGIQLSQRARGEAAITALGPRLQEVAAFYQKPPTELQKLLRQDRSLWANTNGTLYYACEIQIAAAAETVAATNIGPTDIAPFSAEQTFHLHSRKGTGKVIYLDFDGHDASTTSWGADAVARPFDIDGDPNTFSATERDRIVYIWQRVAEDYAMYEIDVTTEEPPSGGLVNSGGGDTNYGIRVVIGGAGGDWYGNAGGVAQFFSFNAGSDLPCWVFPKSLGPDNEKYVAEAVSHEVGHTLGLSHDGTTAGVAYYSGQGNWAPIMGVGYYEPIAQWSKGEYANANNTEDDLAVMLNYGATYRTDDHGNTNAAATVLSGVTFTTNGVISQRTDLDFFRFTTGDGLATIAVNRAPRDSNLRIQSTLYGTNGTVLQVTNVADSSGTGTQPVTLTAQLAAGTYFVSVDGIGSGDPLTTGYSDYDSLGQYLIIGTLPSDSLWLPTAPGTYDWADTANWSSNTLPNGIGATLRINNNISGDQAINLAAPVTLGRLFLGDSDASHAFTIQSSGGALTFNNLSGPAILTKTSAANDTFTTPLTLAGNLVVTNASGTTLTFANSITGPGSLTKTGAGQLLLTGAAGHAGGTIINAGTLALGAGATLAGAIEIRSGAALDVSAVAGGLALASGQSLTGSGAAIGDVTVGSGVTLSPGGAGSAGTLGFTNNLTLNSGATLRFDLSALDTPGSGTNDLINVGGDLTLTGAISVDPTFLATLPASLGTYTLIRYSGLLTGGAANFTAVNYTNRFVMTFDDTTPGEIRLTISGAPSSLVWHGDGATNRWDLVEPTNWFDGASLLAFQQLDTTTFDDSGSVAPAVNLSGTLTPLAITVNSASNYIFAGAGKISGAASLTKQGAGTLTISTTNDFTGAVNVSAGLLKAGSGAALGATNSGTIVANGAQLDLNAQNLGAESIAVSGTGLGAAGAIINSSATTQSNALRFVTLTGNTTFGGTGRWDIRANPTATLTGNNFSLTKVGANAIWLADLTNTGLGNISIQAGTLVIQDSTTLGTAASNVTVEAGATLSLWNTDVNALNKKLVMNGGTLSSDAGDNIFAGTAALNTNTTISVSAGLAMQGAISGTGFTKTGAGALRLTAANTFTGVVTIANGALRAGSSTCLGTTNSGTVIAANARLDVGGQNLGAELVTATGDGLGNAGAIINEGASQQNALRFVTLAGDTTFGGISRWDIRANPTGFLVGSNKTLTKRGPSEVWLVDLGNTGLGNISVAEGTLGIQGTTTLGSAASNITVSSQCSLGLWANNANVLAKAMTMSTGRIYNGNGTNTFAGICSLSGSNTFDVTSATTLDMNGMLSGSGSLWCISGGTLILSSNNTYSGATVINAGTLSIGNGGGFGTPGTGAITNNAALVFNRTNDFTVGNVIAGTGTLTKLGAGVLTLTAANTFTGGVNLNALNAGILRLRNSTALGTNSKTINLKSSGSPNSSGTFGVELENNITLANNLAWNISNDGLANAPNIPALRSRSGTNTIAGNILIQSGGGGARIVSDAGSQLNLTGNITTDVAGGRELYLDGSGLGVFSGTISNGTAATMFVTVNKEDSGTWAFDGTNHSGGAMSIRSGTLTLSGWTGTNSLGVSNGATLTGTGVVRGVTTVNGTIAPGPTGSTGTLYVSNTLTLGGTAWLRIAKTPAPAGDQIRGVSALNYGGALVVTNLGGTFAEGDAFQLFSATTYNGAFSSLTLPVLNPPLTWSNRLALDGSLLVARIPVTAPVITNVTPSPSGTNLDLQFPTQIGVNYILERTDSLEPPVIWSPLSTNAGDGNVQVVSPPVDISLPGQYFRLTAY